MKTFSAYWTERLGVAINQASKEPYPIAVHRGSEDFNALNAVIGQIDSCLEAVFFKQSTDSEGRIVLTIEPQCVSTLVRRLMEFDGTDKEMDNAHSLASGICQTLDIELI